MPAPKKSKRPMARDENKMAVDSGNRAAARRAKEAEMDAKDKKPMKKKGGGKMKTKKMAGGGKCRGMGAATKGGKYSRGG